MSANVDAYTIATYGLSRFNQFPSSELIGGFFFLSFRSGLFLKVLHTFAGLYM